VDANAEPEAALARLASDHLPRWGALWRVPGLATRVRVVVSPRMRTSLGLCAPARGEIRLARFLLEAPESLLLEVLCHEAAHAAVHVRHGRGVRPHGCEWRALMRSAGYTGRARMPAERLAELPPAARRRRVLWRHRCTGCGRERMAGRPVHDWRCLPCTRAGRSGELTVTREAMA